jgi:cysteine-rich repeat protein
LISCGVAFAAACGSGSETRETEAKPDSSGSGNGGAWSFDAAGGSGGEAGDAGMAGNAGSGGHPLDAEADAGMPDATAPDASADTGPDGPTGPNVCGDGWRDPAAEECDDGNTSSLPDSCADDCRVTDLLPVPIQLPDSGLPPKERRKLGLGRHPIAAGDSGFATVFVDYSDQPPDVLLKGFSAKGVPLAGIVTLASGQNQISDADPVVAALPNGKYAATWTDINADGDLRGVALRIVDPATGSSGALGHANSSTAGSQQTPDIVWTGADLVVVWTEHTPSMGTDFGNIRLRRFSSSGYPLGVEETIANTGASEAQPVLETFGGSWVAAWRYSNPAPLEYMGVKTASGTTWTVGPYQSASVQERPALVELDSTHLLAVFAAKSSVAGKDELRLFGTVLDTSLPGPTTATFAIEPLAMGVELYDQTRPATARVGDRIYLAWRSGSAGGLTHPELWLKELVWSSAATSLDLSNEEIPLPRSAAHGDGFQETPALAAAPLWPQGALAAAWHDDGRVFGAIEGTPDFIVEFIPTPVLRLPDSDGGLGK